MIDVCRIEATRKAAEAAYRKALTIDEAYDGRRSVKVRHIGAPSYSRSDMGWRVCWSAEVAG